MLSLTGHRNAIGVFISMISKLSIALRFPFAREWRILLIYLSNLSSTKANGIKLFTLFTFKTCPPIQ